MFEPGDQSDGRERTMPCRQLYPLQTRDRPAAQQPQSERELLVFVRPRHVGNWRVGRFLEPGMHAELRCELVSLSASRIPPDLLQGNHIRVDLAQGPKQSG